MPVKRRIPPNRYIVQWKCASIAPPTIMNTARMTKAPKMPQKSTRRCHIGEILKYVKMATKTKRLSTDNAFSITEPVKNSSPVSEPNQIYTARLNPRASPTQTAD